MHFHKYPYPTNFEFVRSISAGGAFKTRKDSCNIKASANGNDVYHLQVTGKYWKTNDSDAGLRFQGSTKKLEGKQTRLSLSKNGAFKLEDRAGNEILSAAPADFFGQCGEASMFKFIREKGDQFYGCGEKWTGFEHSGKTTKFWNTDVWADFHRESFVNGKNGADPVYVTIPYLILKRGNTFVGLLLDNPYMTYISTARPSSIANQMLLKGQHENFCIGAEEGQPNLYILFGPSLAELTRKLQTLVGTTPLPPAWALGYQQCRWGYRSEKDLLELDAQFRKSEIPVDGLWLDIDYMDAFKVFTFDKKHFPKPPRAFEKLGKAGRKVVPIIDPGVKHEPGYPVYERGRKAGAFCETPQGGEFVGLVWPGETVFPDFSIPSAREWWSKEVADFVSAGVHGAWLDMNDPATGPVENKDMLFDRGSKSHSSYHNQYALGMAMASREGFLKARPDERPFLLSRSGFIGSNRYAAIWTGDNFSNRYHLKNGIATTLNLALSGIPFNGPDMGGFGGDTTPGLIVDWFKAGFLFPFFRNHAIIHSRLQEPWAFGKKTEAILARYIRLRYRLRPYLYQLFAEHELTGEAILRPLFYDFADSDKLPLGLVEDQFMVGPSIMQAPFLEENQASRKVILPGSQPWYSLTDGAWIKGGRKITAKASQLDTPIYIRDNSILPLARINPGENAFAANRVDFHIFLSGNGETEIRYRFDDGASFKYLKGTRSEVTVSAKRRRQSVAITVNTLHTGFGKGDFTFTTTADIKEVSVNGTKADRCSAQGVTPGNGKTITWTI